MAEGEVVLLLVALAGIVGGSDQVAIAAGGMLLLRFLAPPPLWSFLEQYSVSLGVIFLTLGILFPFATGKLGLSSITQLLVSPAGLVAVVIGILASYFGAEGVRFLVVQPEVMVGLVVGTILGVAILGGIPTGPLIAAGFISLIYRMMRI